MKTYDIIIIGAGPSGMMAAFSAKQTNPNLTVLLIEKNATVGKKLKLTGGGRCNVSVQLDNTQFIKNLPCKGKFLYSAIKQFGLVDAQAFFTLHGTPLVEERHHRMFPATLQSQTIIDHFIRRLNDVGVTILYNTTIVEVTDTFVLSHTGRIYYKKLILATGGKTLVETGSSGDGYRFAALFNHTSTALLPAEVPITLDLIEPSLQGISLYDVGLSISNDKGKTVQMIQYDLLFTHFGLSGPGILRLSSDIQRLLLKQKHVHIHIHPLKDSLNNLYHAIEQIKITSPKQSLLNKLTTLLALPKAFVSFVLSQHAIEGNTAIHLFKQSQLNTIIDLFNKVTFTTSQTLGMKRAFVTMGGIELNQINPNTMQSKYNENLFFCGELMDLNGWTGGYNISIALITGHCAGHHAANSLSYIKE